MQGPVEQSTSTLLDLAQTLCDALVDLACKSPAICQINDVNKLQQLINNRKDSQWTADNDTTAIEFINNDKNIIEVTNKVIEMLRNNSDIPVEDLNISVVSLYQVFIIVLSSTPSPFVFRKRQPKALLEELKTHSKYFAKILEHCDKYNPDLKPALTVFSNLSEKIISLYTSVVSAYELLQQDPESAAKALKEYMCSPSQENIKNLYPFAIQLVDKERNFAEIITMYSPKLFDELNKQVNEKPAGTVPPPIPMRKKLLSAGQNLNPGQFAENAAITTQPTVQVVEQSTPTLLDRAQTLCFALAKLAHGRPEVCQQDDLIKLQALIDNRKNSQWTDDDAKTVKEIKNSFYRSAKTSSLGNTCKAFIAFLSGPPSSCFHQIFSLLDNPFTGHLRAFDSTDNPELQLNLDVFSGLFEESLSLYLSLWDKYNNLKEQPAGEKLSAFIKYMKHPSKENKEKLYQFAATMVDEEFKLVEIIKMYCPKLFNELKEQANAKTLRALGTLYANKSVAEAILALQTWINNPSDENKLIPFSAVLVAKTLFGDRSPLASIVWDYSKALFISLEKNVTIQEELQKQANNFGDYLNINPTDALPWLHQQMLNPELTKHGITTTFFTTCFHNHRTAIIDSLAQLPDTQQLKGDILPILLNPAHPVAKVFWATGGVKFELLRKMIELVTGKDERALYWFTINLHASNPDTDYIIFKDCAEEAITNQLVSHLDSYELVAKAKWNPSNRTIFINHMFNQCQRSPGAPVKRFQAILFLCLTSSGRVGSLFWTTMDTKLLSHTIKCVMESEPTLSELKGLIRDLSKVLDNINKAEPEWKAFADCKSDLAGYLLNMKVVYRLCVNLHDDRSPVMSHLLIDFCANPKRGTLIDNLIEAPNKRKYLNKIQAISCQDILCDLLNEESKLGKLFRIKTVEDDLLNTTINAVADLEKRFLYLQQHREHLNSNSLDQLHAFSLKKVCTIIFQKLDVNANGGGFSTRGDLIDWLITYTPISDALKSKYQRILLDCLNSDSELGKLFWTKAMSATLLLNLMKAIPDLALREIYLSFSIHPEYPIPDSISQKCNVKAIRDCLRCVQGADRREFELEIETTIRQEIHRLLEATRNITASYETYRELALLYSKLPADDKGANNIMIIHYHIKASARCSDSKDKEQHKTIIEERIKRFKPREKIISAMQELVEIKTMTSLYADTFLKSLLDESELIGKSFINENELSPELVEKIILAIKDNGICKRVLESSWFKNLLDAQKQKFQPYQPSLAFIKKLDSIDSTCQLKNRLFPKKLIVIESPFNPDKKYSINRNRGGFNTEDNNIGL